MEDYDNDDEYELTDEEIHALHELSDGLDEVLLGSLENGVLDPGFIADVIMDKVSMLFLAQNEPDFDGLEEILLYNYAKIQNRPTWEIN